MKNMIKNTKIFAPFLALAFTISSCQKTVNIYRNAKPVQNVPMNTYDFLKSQEGLFDTLLYLIDKVGLSDTLKTGNVTFFAPQDATIMTSLENVNVSRRTYGRPGNWTLDSIPLAVWDTLLRRYLIEGIVNTDSLNYADGVSLTTLSYGYPMNGKRISTNASGIVNGGSLAIQYSDMNNSRFIKDWSSSLTQTTDLKTTNGMVHTLESQHVFGFTAFVGMAFPESLTPQRSPYPGVPSPIPGIIEASDYDFGGEGFTFHDADASNNGKQYRTDDVDIERSSEGDYDIGWTSAGEWMEYTVNVATTGWYTVDLRVASPGTGGRYHFEFDDTAVTSIMGCPNTGGYQNYTWRTTYAYLTAGTHIMKFYEDNGGMNFTKYRFTLMSSPPPASQPYGTAPAAIPGVIPAANYDKGGQNIAYNDMDLGNNGGKYRSEDVDIEYSSEQYPDVGWTNTGEWEKYTVNVASSGTYKVVIRAASPNANGKIHLLFDGVDKTGVLSIPNTGGYQNYVDITGSVDLTAGTHLMEFYIDNAGFNFSQFTFSK